MTAAEDPTSTQHYHNDHNDTIVVSKRPLSKKRVLFDDRCRVRPIRPLQTYLEPEVRKTLWYDRQDFKASKQECHSIMKEALHQLQQAQQKKHKMRKLAQQKLKTTTLSPNSSQPVIGPSSSQDKKLKTKHLFPPSAFRGLEHFHPKMVFMRDERRQDQWEIVLTEQAQQHMARIGSSLDHDDNDTTTTTDEGPATKVEIKHQRRRKLPREEDLLRLAELSMEITCISAKEARKRALRDEHDLLHPPNHWTLPWLLPAKDSDEMSCISLSPSKLCKTTSFPALSSPLSQSSSTVSKTKLEQLLEFTECGSNPKTNIRKRVM